MKRVNDRFQPLLISLSICSAAGIAALLLASLKEEKNGDRGKGDLSRGLIVIERRKNADSDDNDRDISSLAR